MYIREESKNQKWAGEIPQLGDEVGEEEWRRAVAVRSGAVRGWRDHRRLPASRLWRPGTSGGFRGALAGGNGFRPSTEGRECFAR